MVSWVAASNVPERYCAGTRVGEYIVRVVIQEWPREEYTRREGASEVFIYSVYIPPSHEVNLREITGGGSFLEELVDRVRGIGASAMSSGDQQPGVEDRKPAAFG